MYRHNLGDRPMREDEIGLIVTPEAWQVYQSHEKGGHHIIQSFDHEEDACEMIYKSLKTQKDYDEYRKEMKAKKKK